MPKKYEQELRELSDHIEAVLGRIDPGPSSAGSMQGKIGDLLSHPPDPVLQGLKYQIGQAVVAIEQYLNGPDRS